MIIFSFDVDFLVLVFLRILINSEKKYDFERIKKKNDPSFYVNAYMSDEKGSLYIWEKDVNALNFFFENKIFKKYKYLRCYNWKKCLSYLQLFKPFMIYKNFNKQYQTFYWNVYLAAINLALRSSIFVYHFIPILK